MKRALQIILVFALAGLAFSGTLTYREVFAAAAKCPSPGAPGTILGYPACVYGFLMYLAITVVAIAGLRVGQTHVSVADGDEYPHPA
jgi:uncharacterized membrane protein